MSRVLRIAILGQKGVGKTSFINCFVDQFRRPDNQNVKNTEKLRCPAKWCTVLFSPFPKDEKTREELVDCLFLDVPTLSKFPLDSLEEWEIGGAIGVRSADVFILMYDVTQKTSFDYVIKMQKEIMKSFAITQMSPTLPFFKKRDKDDIWSKISQNANFKRENKGIRRFWTTNRRRFGRSKRCQPQNSCGLAGLITTVIEASRPISACNSYSDIGQKHFKRQPILVVVGNKIDQCGVENILREVNHRETNQMVCKIWKAFHFESSVKFGWNVSAIMRQVIESSH